MSHRSGAIYDLKGRVKQDRNGVRVRVHRLTGGTVVYADCQCFGVEYRPHSRTSCPFLLRQLKEAANG